MDDDAGDVCGRRRYDFYVIGYVVIPEHVHFLISEPDGGTLASAVQAIQQL